MAKLQTSNDAPTSAGPGQRAVLESRRPGKALSAAKRGMQLSRIR